MMTEEELEKIEQTYYLALVNQPAFIEFMMGDYVPALCAEVRRLQEELRRVTYSSANYPDLEA